MQNLKEKDIIDMLGMYIYEDINELVEDIKKEINPDTIDVTNNKIQFTKGQKVYILNMKRFYKISSVEVK